MTLSELYTTTVGRLEPTLGRREAVATARLLLEDTISVTPTALVMHGERSVEPETVARFDRFVKAINAGEPPQYLTGVARFMGMNLKVTPAVLIPRPETAELVDLITDGANGRTDLRVLDIGTGSGCIAIALSRALVFPQIEAVDISDDALGVARDNAAALSARIDFHRVDILTEASSLAGPYDIIVSNPPYITDSERAGMERRVTDYEPASALFVPDSDPLRFYRAIASMAVRALAPGGTLYFEINPLFATQLSDMLRRLGLDCDIRRDAQGRLRFAVAKMMKS